MTKSSQKNISKTRFDKAGFLFVIKWVLSFLWPQCLVKTNDGKEYLELLIYRGSKLVDIRNANYSYGNLQTAYRSLFNELDVEWANVNDVLVLGYSVGGVSTLLFERNPNIKQCGVEYNPQMIKWYHEYFDKIPNVTIFEMDAMDYLNSNQDTFDLIIVDLYENLKVNSRFQTKEFCRQIHDKLEQNGLVVFNKVCKSKEQIDECQMLMLHFSGLFKRVRILEQLSINQFIIATSGQVVT